MSKADRTTKLPAALDKRRDEILRLATRHGARNVRVYGSAARGEAGPDSDIDIVVDLEPGRTLLDLGGLQMDLQDLLGRPVDLKTTSGLREDVRKRVVEQAVPL